MDDRTEETETETGPTEPVDQQAAALDADPGPPGSGAPGGAAEEAGIVDQQDAARAAMEEAERDPDGGG